MLPFVAFKPADGISKAQAIQLLSQLPGSDGDDDSTNSNAMANTSRVPSPKRDQGGEDNVEDCLDGALLAVKCISSITSSSSKSSSEN